MLREPRQSCGSRGPRYAVAAAATRPCCTAHLTCSVVCCPRDGPWPLSSRGRKQYSRLQLLNEPRRASHTQRVPASASSSDPGRPPCSPAASALARRRSAQRQQGRAEAQLHLPARRRVRRGDSTALLALCLLLAASLSRDGGCVPPAGGCARCARRVVSRRKAERSSSTVPSSPRDLSLRRETRHCAARMRQREAAGAQR